MKNEIAIGILDVYEQEDVNLCYSSIPEEYKDNVFIASATKNKKPDSFGGSAYKQFGEVPFATLRNWLISQFRLNEYKYYFIIHSNNSIKDPEIFIKTIKIAETFGSWFLLNEGTKSLPLEDEETGVTLYASPELNSEFMFLFNGIVKNNGYFDERFFNTKEMDVLDYVIRLREKGLYSPAHYNLTISKEMLKKSYSSIKKIGFKDYPDNDKSVGLSYGYFMHKYKYIPGHNEPAGVTQEQLLESLQELQKKYAKHNS